jgi:hypothetical protein
LINSKMKLYLLDPACAVDPLPSMTVITEGVAVFGM